MGETILLYNLGAQGAEISALCQQLGFRCRAIPPMEQGQTLSAALGLLPGQGGAGTVSGAMMVFFATSRERMEELLSALRARGLALEALKAVATATNLSWSAPKLYTELRREHRSMGR